MQKTLFPLAHVIFSFHASPATSTTGHTRNPCANQDNPRRENSTLSTFCSGGIWSYPILFGGKICTQLTYVLIKVRLHTPKGNKRHVLLSLKNVNGIVDYGPHEDVCHSSTEHLLHREQLRSTLGEVLVRVSAATERHDGERCNRSTGYEKQEAQEVGQTQNASGYTSEQRSHCTDLEDGFVVLAESSAYKSRIRSAHVVCVKGKRGE